MGFCFSTSERLHFIDKAYDLGLSLVYLRMK